MKPMFTLFIWNCSKAITIDKDLKPFSIETLNYFSMFILIRKKIFKFILKRLFCDMLNNSVSYLLCHYYYYYYYKVVSSSHHCVSGETVYPRADMASPWLLPQTPWMWWNHRKENKGLLFTLDFTESTFILVMFGRYLTIESWFINQ